MVEADDLQCLTSVLLGHRSISHIPKPPLQSETFLA